MKSRLPDKKKSPTYIHTEITIAGKATFLRTLYVHGAAKFQGKLNVAGLAELDGDLDVAKDAHVGGDVEIDGTLNVTKHAIFCDPVAIKTSLQTKYFTNLESAVFGGTSRFDKTAEFKDIKGDKASFAKANISESLMVGGDILTLGCHQIKNNIDVLGSAYVKGEMAVAGLFGCHDGFISIKDGKFQEKLRVVKEFFAGGESTFHNAVYVKKGLSVKHDLDIGGDVEIVGDLHVQHVYCDKLDVGSDANLKAVAAECINAAGNSAFKSNVDVGGNVAVGGKFSVKGSISTRKALDAGKAKFDELYVKDDATIGANLIIKRGLVVSEQAILTKAHVGELELINGDVRSGVYMPDVVSSDNVELFDVHEAMLTVTGEVVSVSGRVDIQPGNASDVHVQLSLPVKSIFSSTHDLCGNAISHNGLVMAACFADPITSYAKINYHAASTDKVAFFYQFTYRIRT